MDKNKIISVLIPDAESHIALYVLNCLSQVKNIKVFLMSNKKRIPIKYSRFVHHYSYYKKTENELDWVNNINDEVEKFDIDVIVPVWEANIKTLTKLKDKIKFKHKLGLLPSLESFETASHKGLLARHLEKNNIPGPKSVLIELNILENIDTLNYPVLVKPMENTGGGIGIEVFKNKQEVGKYFDKKNIEHQYLVQDYIKGYDIDCSVLCKEGEILAMTIQKGNMIGVNEFSPQIGLEFLYEPELYKVVKKLMKSLSWSGLAHIDARYDINHDEFKVLEVNPRFWVSLEASLIAGVNFPLLYCLSALGENFQKPRYNFVKYLSLKGLVKSIKSNIFFIRKWDFIMYNTPFGFVLKDPLPTIYKFIWRTKNIILTTLTTK